MKKKTYEQPMMKVVKLEQADIICTSTGYNSGNMRFNGGDELLLDEEDW